VHCWFGVVVIGNQITATLEVSGSLFQCIAGLALLSLATKSPLLVITATSEVSESISVHCWFGVVVIGDQITATVAISPVVCV